MSSTASHEEDFLQENGNYRKQLPTEFEGGELLIDLQGNGSREPDWKLIANFEAFLLREGSSLKSRVHEPLKGLAAQTRWFLPEELASAYFDWVEVRLLYSTSELKAKGGAGPVYELQFSMESSSHAWVDTYGTWIATFDKLALIGLRREQI